MSCVRWRYGGGWGELVKVVASNVNHFHIHFSVMDGVLVLLMLK